MREVPKKTGKLLSYVLVAFRMPKYSDEFVVDKVHEVFVPSG